MKLLADFKNCMTFFIKYFFYFTFLINYFFFRLNGFSSGTEMKIEPYESESFVSEMQSTWENLKPLYDQLHAYVRHRLHKYYVIHY